MKKVAIIVTITAAIIITHCLATYAWASHRLHTEYNDVKYNGIYFQWYNWYPVITMMFVMDEKYCDHVFVFPYFYSTAGGS